MSLLTNGLIVFRFLFLFLFNPIPFLSLDQFFLCLPRLDHGVGCRPTEEDPQGVDDLVALGSGMNTPIKVLNYELTLLPDLLYLHPASIPLSSRLLSQPGRRPNIPPKPRLPLPQRVQELLRQTNRLPLRHRPPRRSPGLALLPLTSHRCPLHRPPLRPPWP